MLSRTCLRILVLVAAANLAHALTDEEIFRDFRFNRINPGARSLALGGAFVSIADDATAAQANPAGLGYLLSSEYFAEYRFVDNSNRNTALRESLAAGTETFVASGTSPEDDGAATFLSVVLPAGPKWNLGLSRQDVLRQQNRSVNAFALTSPGSPGAFLLTGDGLLDVSIVSYNFSAGYRWTDKLGVGASVSYSTLDVNARVTNTIVDTNGSVAGGEVLEPALDLATSIDDADWDIGFNVGLIYGNPTNKLRFGAVYRHAPKFSVQEVIAPAPCPPGTVPQGNECALDVSGVYEQLGPAFQNRFATPDSYGVSLGWQVTDKLTIVQDLERVEYSDLTEGFVPGVNVLTDFDAQFVADDALEYRVGVEYVFLAGSTPVALRGGVYTQSDSAIRATSTGTNSYATPAAFPGAGDEVRGAAGVGLAFRQGQYKLDLAAAFGESTNEYLLSFIYRGKLRGK